MTKITLPKLALAAIILGTSAILPCHADTIDPGKGITIDDGSGNSFMEEVIDPNQKIKDEIERERAKQNRSLDRHLLNPDELSNVNMQVTKSGQLIPLINHNATSPVQENTSRMEIYNETLPMIPVATPYGVMPYNPYGPAFNPYSVAPMPYNPYGAYQPYMPYNPMYANPFYARPFANVYQPYPYNPFYNGLGGLQTQMYSSPSYLSTNTSVFTDPSKPGSVSITRDSLLKNPLIQGYATTSPYGTWLGGSINPTTTRSTSTTTFTPIIPDWAK